MSKLVVVPSEALELYEEKGISDWLEEYYNPKGYFDEVYLLSPKEKSKRFQYGMHIIPVASMRHFRSLLRRINPLCVRSYGTYWATQYAVLNRLNNIPVIGSIHDTNPRIIYKSFFKADIIFSMSDATTCIVTNSGYNKENVYTIGNRLNFKKFCKINDVSVREMREEFPRGNMLLFVGRLAYEKNIETILKALSLLPNDYFLVIIGPGNNSNYRKLQQDLNVESRIFWIGSVNNNCLPKWYNACDVFVAPSRWEGFGVTLLEAAACRCKIVSSNISPINEFLASEDLGIKLLDDYLSEIELVNAIKELQRLPESEHLNSNRTYNYIKRKFSYSAVCDREIDVYSKILKENFEQSIIAQFNLQIDRFFFSVKNQIFNLRTRLLNSYKLKSLIRSLRINL